MNANVRRLSLIAALLLIAAPATAKKTAPPADPAPAPPIALSRVDQVIISAQEFSEWMARHKTRLELRDANRAIGQMCERLQDAERRMSSIAEDPLIRPDDLQGREVRRFGEQILFVARQLETVHASVRRLAEVAPAPSDPSLDAERERHAARQAELVAELDRAGKHSREFHAWLIDKPASRGLDEMSRDLDLARDELRGLVLSLGRIASDPAVTLEGLRDLSQVQDCGRALASALGEAQDRVASLAEFQ